MKTKKFFLNLVTDVLPMIIISVLGIFKFKLFIQVLGQETQGMYQLFTQIMFYVSIVDGGLGSAVLFALYQPNTSDDTNKMNEILSGAKRIFSLLGMLVFGIAFVVSFFVPFFIKNNPFTNSYVTLTFLLFACSSVVSYFFVPYQSLLEVKEKRYLYNTVYQVGQIFQSVLEITMLLCGCNFLIILLMHSFIKLISYSTIAVIAKRQFPEYNYNNKTKDYKFTHQVKSLFFHKINGLVSSNIDVLILTNFLGLTAVNVYSTYNYIINMMKQIIEKIYSSTLAIIGNILSRDKKQAFSLFWELNSMMFFIGTSVCVPLVLAIDWFIEIWYEGMVQTDPLIALAFVGVLFLAIVKIPITVFVNAGGLFEETKKCAATDTIVNLVLSLTLIHFLGISGVLFATFISVFIAEYIMKTIVIHNELFKESYITYFMHNIKFFVILMIDLLVGYMLVPYFYLNNFIQWFLSFTVYTIINLIVIFGVYYVFGETKFVKRFSHIIIHNEG